MGRHSACPPKNPQNFDTCTHTSNAQRLLHDSLLLSGKIVSITRDTHNITDKQSARQTLLAVHEQINNVIDLLNLQSLSNYKYNITNNINHTKQYNKLLQLCIQYGQHIYHSIQTTATDDTQRKFLVSLIYKLDHYIKYKIIPYTNSHLSQYFSQFTYPRKYNSLSFYEIIQKPQTFENPNIKALKNNYYFPLMDEAELYQIQEEHISMTEDTDNHEHMDHPVMTTANITNVSDLFQKIQQEETSLPDVDEVIDQEQESHQQPKIKEYRMRFTIFRRRGYSPATTSQTKIFQNFVMTLKTVDPDIHILPIDNMEIKALTSTKYINQIDQSTIHHYFKAQNKSNQTITGEFHISATIPYKDIMAHNEMKNWFAFNCYGHKFSEHQISPMIRIGFLTRVRSITYRDGLRQFIMNHPLWNTQKFPAFHFTLHFRTIRTREPKHISTLILNINAEKIHMEVARDFFQALYDGKRTDSSPNEIPYTFIPTFGNFFTDMDLPKIIHDNEKHITSYGVVLITGINTLDTKVSLKNDTRTNLRTILNSLPPGKGSSNPTLFQQIEHQPNSDWIVCVFQTSDKESVYQRLPYIESDIKGIIKDVDIDNIFLNKIRISGMKMPVSSTTQPRIRCQNISEEAIAHTRTIVSNLNTPPTKRLLQPAVSITPTTRTKNINPWTTTDTNHGHKENNGATLTHQNQIELRITHVETQLKTTDTRLTNLESSCDRLETNCQHTLSRLDYLISLHEASSTNLHHKQTRTVQNSVTCDTPMAGSTATHP